MKKLFLLFCFTVCVLHVAFSQPGEWVWIKGGSLPGQPGNYGVQGISSPNNNPPSTYEPSEWIDLNGNFWMFGGLDNNSNGHSDLWKYDPTTNEWTWMKGPGAVNDSGSYGIQGLSSASNNPPFRVYGNASWVDNQGNLWLFGGYIDTGTQWGTLNDLWKYNISTNEWTWVKGPNTINQPGVYGTQGVPSLTNNPNGRMEMATTWSDNTGDLWMFGGRYSSTQLNDLWRYNISSNQWTWMKGSQSGGQIGVYGTIGIESATNTPGARCSYARWKGSSGKFYLFGGWDYIAGNYFNDLWRYNPLSNNWAWIGGNTNGTYGTQCLFSSSNLPVKRAESRSVWLDQNGDFWLFGGFNNSGTLNDLWKYCVQSNQWIWVSGNNYTDPSGNWGTIGISSPTNMLNGRYGCIGWTDQNNHLYLFGGVSYSPSGGYNDLWKYTIDTTCGVCPTATNISEPNPQSQLQIFPNPSNTTITISFNASSNKNAEIKIFNTLGDQVYFLKDKMSAGRFEKEINVKNFTNGIYFLQIKNDAETLSKKIVVQH